MAYICEIHALAEHVARDGRLGRRAHDNSLSGDGGETIYMRSQMNLDDVVFCEF